MNIFNQGFVAVKMTQYLVQYILVYHGLSWSILGYLGLSQFISGYLRVSRDISGYLLLSWPVSAYLSLFWGIPGLYPVNYAILGYLWPSWAVYVKYQVSGCQRMQERESYCNSNFSLIFFFFFCITDRSYRGACASKNNKKTEKFELQ